MCVSSKTRGITPNIMDLFDSTTHKVLTGVFWHFQTSIHRSLGVLTHLCDGVSDAPPFSTASVLCVPDRALSQSSVLITRTRASGVGSAFGFRILRFVQDSEVRVPEVRV